MSKADSKEYGRIYLLTNMVNGKQYVGQTTGTIEGRFKQHCALRGKCVALEFAIRKYGIEAFSTRELAIAANQDDLDRLEIEFVSSMNTTAPAGYNLSGGGSGAGKMRPETKQRMREIALSPEGMERMRTLRQNSVAMEKIRLAGIKNWPHCADRMRAANSDPQIQMRRVESIRAAYKRPEVSARINAHLAEMRTRPEVRAAKSAELSRIWSDPAEKARRSKAIRDGIARGRAARLAALEIQP